MTRTKHLGDGCVSCPVENCTTMRYRGSSCSVLRANYGVTEDPFSWGDKIRSEGNEYIAKQLFNFFVAGMDTMCAVLGCEMPNLYNNLTQEDYLKFIQTQLYAPYDKKEDKEMPVDIQNAVSNPETNEVKTLLQAKADGKLYTSALGVGQTVYYVNPFHGVKEVTIISIDIDQNGVGSYGCSSKEDYAPVVLRACNFNATYFAEKEQAVKKFEEIKKQDPLTPSFMPVDLKTGEE